MPNRPDIPEEAVEALAEHNAIEELWGWWDDNPTREAKEGRQRKRYAQLSEDVKGSWRDGARRQLALVAPALRKQGAEEERERLRESLKGLPGYRPMNGHVGAPEHRARMVQSDEGRWLSRGGALGVFDAAAPTEPREE